LIKQHLSLGERAQQHGVKSPWNICLHNPDSPNEINNLAEVRITTQQVIQTTVDLPAPDGPDQANIFSLLLSKNEKVFNAA